METLRTPSIIKRIDQYLLKNSPVTWSTRIHTAGLYALGFAILLAIISFIAPNDPRNRSIIHYWIVLVTIISLLAFIFWMIYLLRFNVFKRYGSWKSTDTVKTFIIYFIITAIILSWPFIPPVFESVKANAAYKSNEIIKDINNMNIKICQLEQDSIRTEFETDTLEIDRTTRLITNYTDNDSVAVPDNVSASENYFFIDTAALRKRLEDADSVRKLTDSIYIIYKSPAYRFVYDYSFEDLGETKILSSMDLYRHVIQNKQVIDKEKIRSELGRLFTKYSHAHDPNSLSAGINYTDYREKYYYPRVMEKYDLYLVNNKIENIVDKKYRWDESTIGICWRIIYYFSLCLAMLVLVYRHTTRRTFFLSLLAAVVLSILTSVFIAIVPNKDNSFFIWTICYFILFGVMAAFIFNNRYRNVVSGIGLNLLVFLTPFMPLVITSYYYESLRDRYQYINEWERYRHLFDNEKQNIFFAEIGGGLLLILLLATLYQMAYKKWYALPEQ